MNRHYDDIPWPSLYKNNIVIAEQLSENLEACEFSQIAEIVGTFQLHEAAVNADNKTQVRCVSKAIEKFNSQNQTRLTFDCVKSLEPSYSFVPSGSPIIFSDNMFEFKRMAAVSMHENIFNKWQGVDYNQVDTVISNCPLQEHKTISTLIVYFPEGDFNIIYKSAYWEKAHPVENTFVAMSNRCPMPKIGKERSKLIKAWSFSPEIEAAFKMLDHIVERNQNSYLTAN